MADTLDVLSLANGKKAINMDEANPDHDAALARQITAVSRIMDDLCGPVVQRTVTTELHHGRGEMFRVHRWPVSSITLLREAQSPGTIEVLSAVAWGTNADGYFAEPWKLNPALKSGRIYRKKSGQDASWWSGTNNIEVTYVAGRAATTAAVDARFAEAAGEVLSRLWKRESGTWSQAASVFDEPLDAPSSGFFRAVRPTIDELLSDEVQRGVPLVR